VLPNSAKLKRPTPSGTHRRPQLQARLASDATATSIETVAVGSGAGVYSTPGARRQAPAAGPPSPSSSGSLPASGRRPLSIRQVPAAGWHLRRRLCQARSMG